MKQLLTLLLSLLLLAQLIPAHAQRPAATASLNAGPLYPETPSRAQRQADSLMTNLDKNQVLTGVLYDRVAGMAALDVFNLCYNDPDTSGVGHFMQAYYEMRMAPYVSNNNQPSRQILRDNARYYAERGQVLIGALRYRFNYIDSNAVRNNQLRWSAGVGSQLYDVVGRSGSPYLWREVVVGSALTDTLRRGSTSFRLDPGSTFSNAGGGLHYASINFGDGNGARTCFPGQNISVSYATAGTKTLSYTFTYSDGQQFTTHSSLYVQKGTQSFSTTDEGPCREDTLTAAVSFPGIPGEEVISYYYRKDQILPPNDHCNVPNVTRPVVIIDGFDHNDTRNGRALFNTYLSYRDAGNRNQNLGAELQTAGYDVVIMNAPNVYGSVTFNGVVYRVIIRRGGSDYMERNALALVTLIQELNRQLQAAGSTEKIVVIGPSMGGQIARYALSYMEANNLPHRTRLLVALDSPNNGANIPIGLQHFVKFFAEQTGDSKLVEGLTTLNSPASRQLTQVFHTQNERFDSHPDRFAFLNDLLRMRPDGLPIDARCITVTNGALNGA